MALKKKSKGRAHVFTNCPKDVILCYYVFDICYYDTFRRFNLISASKTITT